MDLRVLPFRISKYQITKDDSLDEIYMCMSDTQSADVRGDVYEYLLAKIASAGVNGQFQTPRHIIKMMVELMDPKADDVICEIPLPKLIQNLAA